MSDSSGSNNYVNCTDEQLAAIHLTCEQYESALQDGPAVRLESYLQDVAEPLQTQLFLELLAIELEWQIARGQTPQVEETLKRFPDRRAQVLQVFQEFSSSPTLGDDARQSTARLQFGSTLTSGTVIDNRFTLGQLIGEGGMGAVYLAEQSAPVRRQVALKVIKNGVDSTSVLARFEAERQTLALMDHPHIAKVYDGGSTSTGQPYFAMELVQGLPITKYCDAERLSVRDRLKLMVLVSEAVQHAHMKGIIHRDLKPANVLVAKADGRATPKVIDFGVAKAIEQNHNDQSAEATAFIVGTPAYMSPEQATPASMDIDTRTDVYSLGVILYEMLVGTPPHEMKSSSGGAVPDLLRLIREEDSPRPSSKLSLAPTLANIAASRDIEPKKLTQMLRSELDWIVLKAVERDRDRRYETANAFARDIERYLAGDLVEAQPPSTGYRLKKFAVRYRRHVIAGSLIAATMLIGLIGTVWGLVEANKQHQLALAEVSQKETALRAADREKSFATAIADFVTQDILALTSLEGRLDFDDPSSALSKDSTLRDLLNRADAKLDARSDLEPRAEARLRWIIGTSFRHHGEYEKAIDSFQRAHALYSESLGNDDVDTLGAMDSLAEALQLNGQLERAKPLIAENLSKKKLLLGDKHVETLQSMRLLAINFRKLAQPAEAIALLEQTLVIRKTEQGSKAHDTLTNMFDLALAYNAADQNEKGLQLLEQTLELQRSALGLNHPDTYACMQQLAASYRQLGKFDKSLPLVEQSLAWTKLNYGEEDHNTIMATAALAASYRDAGQVNRSIDLFEQALMLSQKTLSPQHPDIPNAMSSLAMGYRATGDHERALSLFEQAVELRGAIFDAENPIMLVSKINVAACYRALNRIDEAQELNLQCLELAQAIHGNEHTLTLTIMQNLAASYWSAKQLDRSIPLFEQVLAGKESKLGRSHPDTLAASANLGVNYRDAGRPDEAIPLLEEVYAAASQLPALSFSGVELLDAYLRAGKTELGLELFEGLIATAHEKFSEGSPQRSSNLATMAQILLRSKQLTLAEPLLRECLEARQAAEPDDWRTYSTMAMLGESLLGQQQYANAEPLLCGAYAGMRERDATAPKGAEERLLTTLDCLLELYAALHQEDATAKWQAERNSFQASLADGAQPTPKP